MDILDQLNPKSALQITNHFFCNHTGEAGDDVFCPSKIGNHFPPNSPSTENYPTKPWIDSGSCDVLAISKLRRRHGELRGLCFDGRTAKPGAAWLRKDDAGMWEQL